MVVAFFPGKFQPPHIGHILTISKLLKKYDVIIGISPDEPRVISQQKVKEIFETIFGDRLQCYIFGDILSHYTDISIFPSFDILLTGNDAIIKWANNLNLETKKIPRSFNVSGTYLRKLYEKNK